jgi:hypothetical protein
MRVIACPCGHRLETDDDDEIRVRVAADGYYR